MQLSVRTSPDAFLVFLDGITASTADMWGVATIKRDYLRVMTNDAFVLAIQRQLGEADDVSIFFTSPSRIDIAWRGKQRLVFRQMSTLIETSMLRHELDIPIAAVIAYTNLQTQKDDVLDGLVEIKGRNRIQSKIAAEFPDEIDVEEQEGHDDSLSIALTATMAQKNDYAEVARQRPYRTNLHMLVVEDQPFSQKLLCEILRGARLKNSHENPVIDAVGTTVDAWKIALKKAPDIIFVDLCLTDGSGHGLASAIKALDPMAYVVVVTANNYEEELSIARQNNVDGFIVKPYNKKQILDCVDKYVGSFRSFGRGGYRGSFR